MSTDQDQIKPVVVSVSAGSSGMPADTTELWEYVNPTFVADPDGDSNESMQADSVQQVSKWDRTRRSCLQEIRTYLQQRCKKGSQNLGMVDVVKMRDFLQCFSSTDLLHKLFRLFDYRQDEKLNQRKWIESLKAAAVHHEHAGDDHDSSDDYWSAGGQTLTQAEVKSHEFVDIIESLAYTVCGDADVGFPEFCKIFSAPNVLQKFAHAASAISGQEPQRDAGMVRIDHILDFISQLSCTQPGSRLTPESIAWLESVFRQHVGDAGQIHKTDFWKIMQTKNRFFMDRVFEIFDLDHSGSISLHQFLDAMRTFAGEDPEGKILFLFKVYDVDGDGLIQEKELEQVMRACMEENGLRFTDDQIRELTKALFEATDIDQSGALTYEELKCQLERSEGLLENLAIGIESWLLPEKPSKPRVGGVLRRSGQRMAKCVPQELHWRFIRNNSVYLLWMTALYLVNAFLFVERALEVGIKSESTTYIIFAKGAGQCLNFCCAFIVLCVLRRTLTNLRSRGASAFIPIDQHLSFHKRTGQLIAFWGCFHSAMHFVNIEFGMVRARDNYRSRYTYWDFLFDPQRTCDFGLLKCWTMYTGMLLLVILLVMVICSLPFVRKSGYFEVFYWTHLLYIPFWILLVMHGPVFWRWFLVPGTLFLTEQAVRIFYWRVARGHSYIKIGYALPSKVTHLIVQRPRDFEFNPGDYVFIRVPKIANWEWHPFSISSGPEFEGGISLHISSKGGWTERLYKYFEKHTHVYDSVALGDDGDPPSPTQAHASSSATANNSESNGLQLLDELPMPATGLAVNLSDNRARALTSPLEAIKRAQSVQYSTGRKSKALSFARGTHRSVSFPDDEGQQSNPAVAPVKWKSSTLARYSSTRASDDDIQTYLGLLALLRMRYAPNVISPRTQDAVHEAIELRDSPTLDPQGGWEDLPSSGSEMAAPWRVYSETNYGYDESGTTGAWGMASSNGTSNGYWNWCASLCWMVRRLYSGPTDRRIGSLAMETGRRTQEENLEVFLDGPYGAPANHIFRAQHAVLIATGIGVTPFASILQSIMSRYWTSRSTCPNCNHTFSAECPRSMLRLRKVDFFWINRDQRSFEWFVKLLSELEVQQAELGGAMERFLDMHMYITSALQRTDVKAVVLQLALELLYDHQKRDLITGLKTRTNAGRPNWDKVFQQLKGQRKGKITVFYCGPPELGRTLREKCDKFGFEFRKELF